METLEGGAGNARLSSMASEWMSVQQAQEVFEDEAQL